MKKIISLGLAAAMTAAALGSLSGCHAVEETRQEVTIALWSDQLTEQYGQFLCERFPDVDFTFYVATNSADFYRFKLEHGDLPDILTLRRFSLRDVADWKDSLIDLSDSELASTFHPSYLRSYTYRDGTINWLPTCAEVDSIILNKTLFEENGVPIPEDYEGFITACDLLREKGIRPFGSNFSADYTCMEMLQGLSASALSSQEGREWRQRYESGQTSALDGEVWLPVFERMAEFIDRAGISTSDLAYSQDEVFAAFSSGEFAMMRGTGDELERCRSEGAEMVMLPFFGETEGDNRYLTYPAFQVAAAKSAEEDLARKKLILEIMETMLSGEGLRKIAASQNMVSYSDAQIDLSPSLEGVRAYADDNRLYIRLASADMFSVSRAVVGGMIGGEYPDARAAFDAFNAAIETEEEMPPPAAHIEREYLYAFQKKGGSEAASAVMNTVREETGTELLIAPAAYVAGNIASGDYSADELGFLTMGEGVSTLTCRMTGDQVKRYISYVLSVKGRRGSVVNESTLYVTSGFKTIVAKNGDGYEPVEITSDGGALDPDRVYTVTVIGNFTLMLGDALAAAGVTDYADTGRDYKEIVASRLASGKQLAEPTDYITLNG
ncbi:MAG: extracellular solute-binding protein [Bacteroides sp.]|nr:extracellular solute-binding protein [Eubacterium sp.]MCM1417400.1 extracellular solute-binding protein [Roseburia sp.]MCM1461407.1 extracellular solute-binding protein [Bacteroides sp.]